MARGELCDIINGAAPPKDGSKAADPLTVGVIGGGGDAATNKFDAIVGALEDIICDETFVDAQRAFCLAHCDVFEDTEENKLEYTPLFEQYVETMEAIIDERLKAAVEAFDMTEFLGMLEAEQAKAEAEGAEGEDGSSSLEGDVFEMLFELGDFEAFKGLVLSFKVEAAGEGLGVCCGADGPQAARPGGSTEQFGLGISVMSLEPAGK